MTTSILTTTSEVVDALGGTRAVAALTGRTGTAVSNWKARRRFPPETYVLLSHELLNLGLQAPARLWKMEAPHVRQPNEAA